MTGRGSATPIRGESFFPGACVFLAALGYFAALAAYGIELPDEGHLIHQIYRTFQGQVPYIDFHTGYTPGVYYWNATVFSLFGVNLLVLRLCLAVVHALTVYSIYWLARKLDVSVAAAVPAAMAYPALIPFFDGRFASFNIPYPAWYATMFWQLSVVCVVWWWRRGAPLAWLAAGLATGVVFSVKPNSGLLNLAALLLPLTLLQRPEIPAGTAPGRARLTLHRIEMVLRWLIPLILAVGLTLTFAGGVGNGSRRIVVFVLPLLALIGLHLLFPSARRPARSVPALSVWRDLILLGVGFGAVTLPWLVYFWIRLGTTALLRSVLYVGTNYQDVYFIPYPPLSPWGLAVAVLLLGGIAAGALTQRGWLPRRLIVAGSVTALVVAAALLWAKPPPMVEGFQASVVMRFRDIAFVLFLFVIWYAIGAHVARFFRHDDNVVEEANASRAGLFLILLLSAVLMHMQIYPRADFMHALFAAPAILVLAAWIMDATKRVWQRALGPAPLGVRAAGVTVFVPVYVLLLVLLGPALSRIDYIVRARWSGSTEALVELETPRAPLVVEASAGRLMEDLSLLLRYIRQRTDPGEPVFTFPCLDMLAFLLDRPDPTRHGYYYPGSPGHAVEAEVIDSLRSRQPRYVVALHDHAFFFVAAPVYYFNLRDYLVGNYSLAERVGFFDVFRRQGAEESIEVAGTGRDGGVERAAEDALPRDINLWRADLRHRRGGVARRVESSLAQLKKADAENLGQLIAAADEKVQTELAWLVRRSRSAAGGAALARALREPGLPDRLSRLFVRIIAETADARAIVPLLTGWWGADVPGRMAIAGDLFTIGSRLWVEAYWLAPPKKQAFSAIDAALDDATLIRWIDDPWQSVALRSFAIRIVGRLGRKNTVPFLIRILTDVEELPFLRVDAADSLVSLDTGPSIIPAIAALLDHDTLLPAALTVRMYPKDPALGRTVLMERMRSLDRAMRAKAFWMAAGVSDPALAEELRRGLHDSFAEVRMAAAWGLGNLKDRASLESLRELVAAPDDEVRPFAQRSIRRIENAGTDQRVG